MSEGVKDIPNMMVKHAAFYSMPMSVDDINFGYTNKKTL